MPCADIRAGPLPPPFPPIDPRDPLFPRRAYRPDFFPPPPASEFNFTLQPHHEHWWHLFESAVTCGVLSTARGLPPPPLPPGVFPRIPLPPHMAFPPMRPPPADHVSPEPPSRPSPPGSEQPPEQPPPAHDIIWSLAPSLHLSPSILSPMCVPAQCTLADFP